MLKEIQLHRLHSTKLIDSTLKKWRAPKGNYHLPIPRSNQLYFCKCLKLKHQVVQGFDPSTIQHSWFRDVCWELCWYGLDFHNDQRKKVWNLGDLTLWDFFWVLAGIILPRKTAVGSSNKGKWSFLNGDQKIPKHKLHSWVDIMPKANRFCKLPKTHCFFANKTCKIKVYKYLRLFNIYITNYNNLCHRIFLAGM